VIAAIKPSISLYMGGMGAKDQNFHKQVFDRMGYADVADRVQELYLEGRKDEATALVPDELVDQMHIIGDVAKVRDRVQEWEDSGVTTLLLSLRSPEELRRVADVVANR
jgi:alkanesulfonate monooxygenase SsuD/methylene tetrahydromethanopterin reductase-like flavin-dependent oxidoreductase (luciferase family)